MARRNRRKMTPAQRRDRRARRLQRWLADPLRWILLSILGAGVGYGAYHVARFLYTSPALAVRCIEVRGTQRTRVATLLHAGRVEEGMNIFALDLDRVCERIEELPWVRRARATRRVPDTLALEVEEHVPAAVINLGVLYYLDHQREVFKRLQPGEHSDHVVLTGLDRNDYEDAPERTDAVIAGMLALLGDLRNQPCLREYRVAEIHHDGLMGPTVVLDPGALSVRLGRSPRARLPELCKLLVRLKDRDVQAHTVYLDHGSRPGWATVRLDPNAIASRHGDSTSMTNPEAR